ncbi:MAG: UDP-N-acetylmuramoyl-L-alanyl-D-glutamate--2,6-diaminopimelate ligase [Egibacteraceae bacterium]
MTPTELLAVLPGGPRLHATQRAGAQVDVRLVDVTHDSRQAGPGVLFACRPGQRVDGHDFARRAVAVGSPALLVERRCDLAVPQIIVRSVADALGPAAAAIHGHPSRALMLLGVTGTNGKTTTAYLLESVLRAAGHVTGLIGTVQTLVAGQSIPGVRTRPESTDLQRLSRSEPSCSTTPESTDLQRLLRRMVNAKVTAVAMEVTSHALALGRVVGTEFAAAVFTNLTQDHLDFHGHLEDYYAAKARLFHPEYTRVGVVNVDDPWGRRLATAAPVAVLRVSPSGAAADADVAALDVEAGRVGSTLTVACAGERVRLRVRLPGRFNVANALCALAAAHAVGVDLDAAVAGIAALDGVPGRMERVDAGQPFTVLVDYAHSPDSVANVLVAARDLAGPRRVLVVVGCGGDRDATKRSLMGRAAAEFADLAFLTSDNPRSEDPLAILDMMVSGAQAVPQAAWTVEPDRRAAIALALQAAVPGDVVVIAGKGHESYQEFADLVLPFDDRLVARELLEVGEVPT